MAHYKTCKKFTIHHNLYRIIFIHVFIKKWKIKILYIIIVVCIIIYHMSTLINNLYIYIFYIYLVNSYDPFFITIYTDLHTQHTEFEFFFIRNRIFELQSNIFPIKRSLQTIHSLENEISHIFIFIMKV